MQSTIAGVTFLSVVQTIAHQTGLTKEDLIRNAGVDLDALSLENTRVPAEKLSQVFNDAVQKTNDPYLALRIGEAIPYQSLGILGYLLINAATVEEMLEKFNRYQKLVGERLKFDVSENEQHFKIALYLQGNPHIPVPRFHAEVHLCAILNIITQISGVHVLPECTRFWHEKPQEIEGYVRVFGKNIVFGASESTLYLSKKSLQVPLRFSNMAMLKYFEDQAKKILDDLEDKSVYSNVKQLILQHLGEEVLTIDSVAVKMGTSVRVLQKRLKEENHTFRQALSQVRNQLALHYIQNTDMDMESIAIYLGYSESSAFLRAFKKQTGKRPGEYRKNC